MYPVLKSPLKKSGSFSPLSTISAINAYTPYQDKPEIVFTGLKRKTLEAPHDNGSFIKPLKQSFIRNPRLMPMTRMMLSLLSGWNGAGQGGIETTTGTIAKHLSRSNRMVFNYLQDAMEEGYLTYCRIKDRMGYYIGIKIFLNFGAIRKTFKPKSPNKNQMKTAEIRERKYTAEINTNLLLNKDLDEKIMTTLARFAHKAGFLSDNEPPIPIE